MLIKSLAGLITAAAFGLLAGCATPCGAPGRLCASAEPNTSASPATAAAVPQVPAAPGPEARAAPGPTVRIALLLPLQSDKLRLPAEAVRAGFMAAYQRQRPGFEVDLVSTGDDVQETLEAYRQAATRDDIIVGPLARPAVDALATGGALTRPTLALNHPDHAATLPAPMLVIGLSIEDEARQVADWAAAEHPTGRALVLGGAAAWQQRMAGAFEARWTELGLASGRTEVAADGIIGQDALEQLRARLEIDPPELVFAALDAGQLRLVRPVLGKAIPCYGASPANPGRQAGAAVPELDGLRLLDLPWEVQAGAPQVALYPRWSESGHPPEIDRLYALGIDAFRVAREVALHPGAPFTLDGVTGILRSRPGRIERTEATVLYQDGRFVPAR
jgi:uncharacterized protein